MIAPFAAIAPASTSLDTASVTRPNPAKCRRCQLVTDGDLVGVLYLLGRVQEGTDNAAAAMEFYERVVSVDIRFRDTAQRIERLRGVRR